MEEEKNGVFRLVPVKRGGPGRVKAGFIPDGKEKRIGTLFRQAFRYVASHNEWKQLVGTGYFEKINENQKSPDAINAVTGKGLIKRQPENPPADTVTKKEIQIAQAIGNMSEIQKDQLLKVLHGEDIQADNIQADNTQDTPVDENPDTDTGDNPQDNTYLPNGETEETDDKV